MFNDTRDRGTSNFQILWEIFGQGDIIVNTYGAHACRVIDTVIVEEKRLNGVVERCLEVEVEYVDFQGDCPISSQNPRIQRR